MLRRMLVCFAFATWCFLNTWVELAEGRSTHFARQYPLSSAAVPVICWEALIGFGMFAVWTWSSHRFARYRWPHFVFLAACTVPAGIASVAALRILPVNVEALVRSGWLWLAGAIAGLAVIAYAY